MHESKAGLRGSKFNSLLGRTSNAIDLSNECKFGATPNQALLSCIAARLNQKIEEYSMLQKNPVTATLAALALVVAQVMQSVPKV